jgi:hypothetical protein
MLAPIADIAERQADNPQQHQEARRYQHNLAMTSVRHIPSLLLSTASVLCQ